MKCVKHKGDDDSQWCW